MHIEKDGWIFRVRMWIKRPWDATVFFFIAFVFASSPLRFGRPFFVFLFCRNTDSFHNLPRGQIIKHTGFFYLSPPVPLNWKKREIVQYRSTNDKILSVQVKLGPSKRLLTRAANQTVNLDYHYNLTVHNTYIFCILLLVVGVEENSENTLAVNLYRRRNECDFLNC